jgi:sugar lactone lactonase YvrE
VNAHLDLDRALPTLAVDSRCALGESVLWCERRAALYWTDIDASRLWMHQPYRDVTRHWALPDRLGSLALCQTGQLLLGLAKGLYLADPDAAQEEILALEKLADVEAGNAETRINDGRSDRNGNFVFGTKSERADGAPIGSFYQYSGRHGLRRLDLPAAAIPNSLCFSADGRRMYYCDSAKPQILYCDYDARAAAVSDSRVFAEVDDADASPDGSIIDADGCLWNAQWGAGRVVRYRGDGQVDKVIPLPVKNPSCCTIGGSAYDRLYISSARVDNSVQELARTPGAGGIWQIALPRALGLPESRIELA